jgi:type I restriction enzyme S subunit
MNTLEKLIAKLCPDGVEYKPLEEVFDFHNGYTPSKSNHDYWTAGDIPWFRLEDIRANGRVLLDSIQHVTRKAIKGELFPANSLIVSTSATIGEYALVLVPALTNQRFTALSVKSELTNHIETGFVKHIGYSIGVYCKSNVNQGNFASVDMAAFRKFMFPLPPLPVQQEIVRMLDEMSGLIDALEEELAARKKQYKWSRERLLTFGDDVERKALGKVANICRGVRVVKAQLSKVGKYPVYQNSITPLGYHLEYNCKAGTPFVIAAGAAGEIGYCNVDYWAADDCYYIETDGNLDGRYVYYCLVTMQLQLTSKVRKASVPRLARSFVESLEMPLPPLPVQQEIVCKLDEMTALISALEEESALRKQQYEYYREKLLTFQRKETA